MCTGVHFWVLLQQLDTSRYLAGCQQEVPGWQVLLALTSTEHHSPHQRPQQKQVQQHPVFGHVA